MMLNWKNLDTLASYEELKKVEACQCGRGNVRRKRRRTCKKLQHSDDGWSYL